MAKYHVTPIPRAEAQDLDETSRPAASGLQAFVLPLWMISFAVSLVLSCGVQGALRGAFVGSGSYIPTADRAADLAAQVTGILTCVLLIHLGIQVPRMVRSIALGVMTVVLTLLVVLPLYTAHRLVLPSWASGMVALIAGLLGWLVSLAPGVGRAARPALVLTGITLGLSGLELLLSREAKELSEALFGLRIVSALLAVAWLGAERLRRSQPVRQAAVLGAATLLYLTGSSGDAADPPWAALASRTIAELMSGAGRFALLEWGWCWAFVGFVVELASSKSGPRADRQTLLPLLLLLGLSPPAPLVAGAFALTGLTLMNLGPNRDA